MDGLVRFLEGPAGNVLNWTAFLRSLCGPWEAAGRSGPCKANIRSLHASYYRSPYKRRIDCSTYTVFREPCRGNTRTCVEAMRMEAQWRLFKGLAGSSADHHCKTCRNKTCFNIRGRDHTTIQNKSHESVVWFRRLQYESHYKT